MTCPSGKKTYRDADTAGRMAAALSRLRYEGVALYVYRCPHCANYHTTRRQPWTPATSTRSSSASARS